jgi:ferredoxin
MKDKLSEIQKQLEEGKITRREFLRSAMVIGASLGMAEVLAACGLEPAPISTPTQQSEFVALIPNTDNIIPTPAGSPKTFPGSTAGELGGTTGSIVSATATPRKEVLWRCAACGETFHTLEALKTHAGREHAWRLPEIIRVDKPTYDQFIVGKIERFDERNTALSRSRWDKPYQARLQSAAMKATPGDWASFERQALMVGAIYVDQTAGSLHPNYYGYNGYVRDSGGLFAWEEPVNEIQFPVPDSAWMTQRVKETARFYGADLVGICKLDQRWVYSHYFEAITGNYGKLEIPHKYAIVLAIEMDWKLLNEAPGFGASASTALGYSRMAEVASSLAAYIRALGYPALPSGGDSAQNIPLAIDAGLGELGRHGLLITPEFGPRVRLCKVFTDLPLDIDGPIDFGIQAFCDTCHICSKTCPVGAIRDEERTTEITSISNRRGLLRWPVNVTRCLEFWRENGTDCANCVAVCPWALHSQRDWLEL